MLEPDSLREAGGGSFNPRNDGPLMDGGGSGAVVEVERGGWGGLGRETVGFTAAGVAMRCVCVAPAGSVVRCV